MLAWLILWSTSITVPVILLILKIKEKYDLEVKQSFIDYKTIKRNELDEKIGIAWNMFYESYLYVYSNQHLVPNDKEFLEYRRNFLGYLKMRLSKTELKEYYEIFYEEKIFNDYVEYEFLRKFQKVFIGSVLDELNALMEEKKNKKNNILAK